MKKFQYVFIDSDVGIADMGLNGWELISVTVNMGHYKYYFKKEIL